MEAGSKVGSWFLVRYTQLPPSLPHLNLSISTLRQTKHPIVIYLSDRDLSHEGVHIPKIGEHQSSILPSNNPKILSTEQNPVFGPHSPTKSSPNSARKLQEVFQQEGDRMDGKERLASLVQSIEAEMQKAGIKVDCTELNTQLNRLREKEITLDIPFSSSANGDYLKVGFHYPSTPTTSLNSPKLIDNEPQINPVPLTQNALPKATQQSNAKDWASLFRTQKS